nr:AraC family transcriptional regulator [uncultured Megasphaera sp.]
MLFYPTWCGHYYCMKQYFMRRESYAALLLIYIRSGIMNISFRGKDYRAHQGDVVLLDCYEPHYYQAEDGLEFLYLHFDGSNARELTDYILENTGPLIQLDTNSEIDQGLYDMVSFYEKDGLETPFQVSLRIYKLLALLSIPNKTTVRSQDPIASAVKYIHNHIGKDITLKELAEVAQLSPYYFAHCFKEQTGYAPIEYVINSKINQAKIMLVHGTESVESIAFSLGYSSSNSLINLFLKRIGMTPHQYRKHNRNH